MPDQPAAVTVTAAQTEAALRRWLELLDADVHASLAEPEDGGPDQYPFEAANLHRLLQAAAGQPAAPADVTVYELRTGPADDDRPEVIAQYATTNAAALHGEAQYRAAHGTPDALEWQPVGTDTAPVWRLTAVDDLAGYETETDWHIVAVTVPAAYTPAGGAS